MYIRMDLYIYNYDVNKTSIYTHIHIYACIHQQKCTYIHIYILR